jgi:hypothetical protein
MEAPQVIDLIGKAAGGSEKAMKALGISVTDAEIEARALADTGKASAEALTDAELAAAGYALVLEELKPKLDEVAQGNGDVEQKASELEARWETLTGKIGAAIEGPLNDFLGWVLAGVDGLGMMDEYLAMVEQQFRDFLGPVASAVQALEDLRRVLRQVLGLQGDVASAPLPTGTGISPGVSDSSQYNAQGVTLNVVPRDSSDTERAVVEALSNYFQRNGSQAI